MLGILVNNLKTVLGRVGKHTTWFAHNYGQFAAPRVKYTETVKIVIAQNHIVDAAWKVYSESHPDSVSFNILGKAFVEYHKVISNELKLIPDFDKTEEELPVGEEVLDAIRIFNGLSGPEQETFYQLTDK